MTEKEEINLDCSNITKTPLTNKFIHDEINSKKTFDEDYINNNIDNNNENNNNENNNNNNNNNNNIENNNFNKELQNNLNNINNNNNNNEENNINFINENSKSINLNKRITSALNTNTSSIRSKHLNSHSSNNLLNNSNNSIISNNINNNNNFLKSDIKLISKIYIKNFPSSNEILQLLEEFYSQHNYNSNYNINIEGENLIIKINNINIAFNFAKKLGIEKLINPVFKKIIVNLQMEAIKTGNYYERIFKKSNSNLNVFNNNIVKKNNNYNNNIESNSYKKINIRKKLKKIKLYEKNNNNIKSNKEIIKNIQDFNNKCLKNYEKPLNKLNVSDRVKKLETSILASTPYIDRYDEFKKRKKENKLRWIVNHNFNCFIGRASENRRYESFHDFVNKYNDIPYVLRKEDKSKWIIPKNFWV